MTKMGLRYNEREALIQFVSKVRQSLGKNLAYIKLFGSKARRDSGKSSDIDVLVAVHHLSSGVKDRVIDAAFDVNLEYQVFISPRVVPVRVLSARVWRITPFVKNIKREGILL